MSNIPIFLSSDNNYAPFVATTIASICDNTQSFIDFYILDGGITKENQEKIEKLKEKFSNFSIEFLIIDVEDIFKGFEEGFSTTLSMYNRFIIGNLKPKLSKVLYLDVDIIVIGDILELYNQKLESYALAAVFDQCPEEDIKKLKNNIDMGKESKYFNSGVLLLSLDVWRERDILKTLFDIENKYRGRLLCPDQDILNKYFENNYKMLDKKFNVIFDNSEIIIRHFAGIIKPWQADFYLDTKTNKPILAQNIKDFWKYAKMTSFYEEILKIKETFLKSNILWQRYNTIVNRVTK